MKTRTYSTKMGGGGYEATPVRFPTGPTRTMNSKSIQPGPSETKPITGGKNTAANPSATRKPTSNMGY